MEILSVDISMPIFKCKVDNHKTIKSLILNSIKDMGTFSYVTKDDRISNTDWHLGREVDRLYYIHVETLITKTCKDLQQYFNYKKNNINMINYWFQQYAKGDFHKWHTHPDSAFSCVYYVDLYNNNPATTFIINNKEFVVPVEEGTVLIFPSFLEHMSKENKSDYTKTVISFNLIV